LAADNVKRPVSAYVLDVRVDIITLSELLQFIKGAVDNSAQAIVANVNVHAVNLACDKPWFRDFLNDADLVFCDGAGVKLGAKLLGQPIPYRYTPPDWIDELCCLCVENDYSLFLLGGRPGVAQKMADTLLLNFPALRLVGVHHGYYDKSPDSPENLQIIERINETKADILLVGFGMPLQERWLLDNMPLLAIKVALPVGALLDYVAGEVYRMPRWITDNGLEWLARLMIEPRRLWRRYIVGNPLFLWRVFKQRVGLWP
jgi:N-acetylglucosaminyldiphosphoundecaprenol N-acetyl-beta-D-mannosaminyltransferase